MSEKELGRALLDLDSHKLSGVADSREHTWKILDRDRRSVWWLTALTMVLWAAAIGMVLWMLVAFGLLFPKQAQLTKHIREGKITEQVREEVAATHQIALQMITLGVTASVGITCLAILASVFLSFASRRATLRQINASLLEISQQLKELKQNTPASGRA